MKPLSRRDALGRLAAAAGGTLAGIGTRALPGQAPGLTARAAGAPAGAAPPAPPAVPGWPAFVHARLGVAFQYPPGWTVRILESGQPSIAEGHDGLSGARAYGTLFTVKEGTSSAALIYVLATNLGLLLDGFRAVEGVRLSTKPDLSALRYVYTGPDGPRKGTLTIAVARGGGSALGFDAPAGAYAARVGTLTTVIRTFRWFKSSLDLKETTEGREHAYSVMIPAGWTADLRVIRPTVEAGFVFGATDPTGRVTAEIHRPQTPAFTVPAPSLPFREGSWYPLGAQWGWEPLLVYRYLPGKEYLRSFLLPSLQTARPGLVLTGWGDRPDLTLYPEAQAAARAFGGSVAAGEAEYAWRHGDGTRMRGRAVAVTVYVPLPGGRGLAQWVAPLVLRAEAPDAQYDTAVVAMITLNGSFRPDPRWYAAEIAGAQKRWDIIERTQRELFQTYKKVVKARQKAFYDAAEKWDQHIRDTPSSGSDFGTVVAYGESSVRTADGRIIPVIELGGKSVADWMRENPSGYLQKVW